MRTASPTAGDTLGAQAREGNGTAPLIEPDGGLAGRHGGGMENSGLPDPEELPLHIRNVATLRGLGFTYSQIGRHYGITPQAASILLHRQKTHLSKAMNASELNGLSPRAVNCLGRLRIRNRAGARCHPDILAALREQRNCGQKTIDEIIRWSGLDSVTATKGKRPKKVAVQSGRN